MADDTKDYPDPCEELAEASQEQARIREQLKEADHAVRVQVDQTILWLHETAPGPVFVEATQRTLRMEQDEIDKVSYVLQRLFCAEEDVPF